MQKRKGLICILLFFWGLNVSGQCPHNIDSVVRITVMSEGSQKDLSEIYNNPNCSIPLLLSYFSDTTTVFVGCLDTLSSLISNGHFTYVGIRAALIIEWLLSDNTNEYRLCGKTPSRYMSGIVIKDNQIYGSLSFGDYKQIEEKYLDFWRKHKNEDIASLRQKFNRFETILSGTRYRWW